MLVDDLDLTDMVLAGLSMGTGQVTRCLGIYGSGRVAKAVLIGAIPPFLLKTDDNLEGVDQGVFDRSRPRWSRWEHRSGDLRPVAAHARAVRAGGGMLTRFAWEVHHEPASSGHP